MWHLRKHGTDNVFFRFLCDEEYTVGRKDTTVVILNDASVSRSHALITVSGISSVEPADVNSSVPLLRIKDLGSKYGTWLNKRRLEPRTETVISDRDVVTFGQLGSSFVVSYEPPFVVTSSCLLSSEKATLKNALAKLGGRLTSDWTESCTHLVMNSIRLTVKTTSALIAAKPVVTLDYFLDTVKQTREKVWTALDVSSYIPEVSEECLTIQKEALDRNESRKTLFAGKTFLFLSKEQHDKLAGLLTSGGGQTRVVKDSARLRADCLAENVCVFRPPDGADHPICKYLVENKLRAIPESDVALAVAYCSSERHCNPRSTVAGLLWGNSDTLSSQSQAPSLGKVCVPDTQDSSQPSAVQNMGLDTRQTACTTVVEESRVIPTLTAPSATAGDDQVLLTLGTSCGTAAPTTLSRSTLRSPFTVTVGGSPVKLASGLTGTPATTANGSSPSPKRSPKKIRKKDAKKTLPLHFYFSQDKKRRASPPETPQSKQLKLADGDAVLSSDVKEEVDSPPPVEMEQGEELSSEHNDMLPAEDAGERGLVTCEASPHEVVRNPEHTNGVAEWVGKNNLPLAPAVNLNSPDRLGDLENDDGLIERSMVVVELASLVVTTRPDAPPRGVCNGSSTDGPNFKRFRKVNGTNLRGLPKIIGGRDLAIYIPNREEELYSEEELQSQGNANLFNYNPPDPKRRRQ